MRGSRRILDGESHHIFTTLGPNAEIGALDGVPRIQITYEFICPSMKGCAKAEQSHKVHSHSYIKGTAPHRVEAV